MDDVLAICMAHALERRGEAKILAVMHDAGIPEGKEQLYWHCSSSYQIQTRHIAVDADADELTYCAL